MSVTEHGKQGKKDLCVSHYRRCTPYGRVKRLFLAESASNGTLPSFALSVAVAVAVLSPQTSQPRESFQSCSPSCFSIRNSHIVATVLLKSVGGRREIGPPIGGEFGPCVKIGVESHRLVFVRVKIKHFTSGQERRTQTHLN